MNKQKKFQMETKHWILIILLLISITACYYLVLPYINAIIFAFILSLLCFPLHQKICQLFKNKPNISAVITCSIITFILVIPFFFIFMAVVNQGSAFTDSSYKWLSSGGPKSLLNHPYAQKIIDYINHSVPFLNINIQTIIHKITEVASQLGSMLLNFSAKILSDATSFFINFFLMLFVLFFMLRDNNKVIDTLRHLIPLTRSQEDELLNEITKVSKSAILGSFLTALAQGFFGGIAMYVVGFPGFFWGTVMAFTSFIPLIGSALVWIPASLYLLFLGEWQWSLFLAIWSILIVGSIDNFLRPILMKGGNAGMNTILIFFSIMGGIQLLGLIGILYGPIIFSITIVLFKLYKIEFKTFLDHQDKN